MARKPGKGGRRKQRFTVLVVVEGSTEAAFLGHLKSLYEVRGRRSIKIKNAHGGSPQDIVNLALRLSHPSAGEFDRVVVLLDADRIETEAEHERLQKSAKGLLLLAAEPCIESVLLSIIDPDGRWSNRAPGTLKHQLGSHFSDEVRETQPSSYAGIQAFCRDALDRCRRQVGEANCGSHCKAAYTLLSQLIAAVFDPETVDS